MRSRKPLGFTLVALVLMNAVSIVAAGNGWHDLLVPHDGSLAGSKIASGVYRVRYEAHGTTATLTFQKGKKVVATVEGQIVSRGEKNSSNAVVYDTKSDGTLAIREIRFADQSDTIVLKD